MATKYRVVQIKGAKPDTFIVVGIDFENSAITSTSESMREPEMRVYLQKAGASGNDIKTWIDQARSYPGNSEVGGPVTPAPVPDAKAPTKPRKKRYV